MFCETCDGSRKVQCEWVECTSKKYFAERDGKGCERCGSSGYINEPTKEMYEDVEANRNVKKEMERKQSIRLALDLYIQRNKLKTYADEGYPAYAEALTHKSEHPDADVNGFGYCGKSNPHHTCKRHCEKSTEDREKCSYRDCDGKLDIFLEECEKCGRETSWGNCNKLECPLSDRPHLDKESSPFREVEYYDTIDQEVEVQLGNPCPACAYRGVQSADCPACKGSGRVYHGSCKDGLHATRRECDRSQPPCQWSQEKEPWVKARLKTLSQLCDCKQGQLLARKGLGVKAPAQPNRSEWAEYAQTPDFSGYTTAPDWSGYGRLTPGEYYDAGALQETRCDKCEGA